MSQTNMLLHGIAPERTRASYGSIDGTRALSIVLHGDLNLRADRAPFVSPPVKRTLIQSLSLWILNTRSWCVCPKDCAAESRQDIFMSASLQVRKRNAMSLMYFAGPRRRRNICKALAIIIRKRHAALARQSRVVPCQIGIIQIAIVVHVAELLPIGIKTLSRPDFAVTS